jgi:hypothetical protein
VSEENLSEEEEFKQTILYNRLEYLKELKLRGHKVDDAEIDRLDELVYPERHQSTNDADRSLGNSHVEDLQRQFAVGDLLSQAENKTTDAIKLLLLRRGYIVVRMRPDPNHHRPHFHIEYKRQYFASYAIDSLERLAGYLPSKYEKPVLEWAAHNRRSLNSTWGKLKAGEIVTELVIEREGD